MTPTLHNNTSGDQHRARELLRKLFADRPFEDELLLTNLGLFARASALAKVLFIHEAHALVRGLPGDILVFGVWLGQDMVLFESMRAITEPYNASRKIIGFDTFAGYPDPASTDETSDVVKKGGYGVPSGYAEFLTQLLAYHRAENVMGHAVTHTLVQGDIIDTLPEYLADHPECLVALAYFDMAMYEPTTAALSVLSERLMPGSVLVMDELNDPRYPGETVAFREWARERRYRIQRSLILPDRTFVVVE